MVKGVVDFLIGDSKEARILRKKCIFKIVPMLNPDGVIYGNYRCSLLGVDLNRRWKHPNPLMHPTIYYTKKLIKILSEEREVALFCDFHGHSIKRNIFTYACSYKNQTTVKNKQNLLIRLLPYLLSKTNPLFNFESSHFRLEKSKQATARVVNFKEHKILASYTLEASFFGSKNSNSHYSVNDLETIGKDLCSVCTVFVSQREFRHKMQELSNFLLVPQLGKSGSKVGFGKDLRTEKGQDGKIQSLNEDSENEMNCDLGLSRDEDEEQGDSNVFSLKEELERIQDNRLEQLMINEEEDDSGGSDSQASINDDKKIKFLMKKRKKAKRKKLRNSESPDKSNHIPQNLSCSQVKSNSVTPDVVIKSRAKSRNSLRKRSEVATKQIIPTKIMLRSPFMEENSESRSGSSFAVYQSSSRSIIREGSLVKPIKKLNDFLRDIGIYESNAHVKSSIQKLKKNTESLKFPL